MKKTLCALITITMFITLTFVSCKGSTEKQETKLEADSTERPQEVTAPVDEKKQDASQGSTEQTAVITTQQSKEQKTPQAQTPPTNTPTPAPTQQTNPGVTPTAPQTTQKYINIGSTKDEVISILGNPNSMDNLHFPLYRYYYGKSTLFLLSKDNNLEVVGWYNNGGNLKVSMGEKIASSAPFTLGSSQDAVVKAMGTPYIVEPYYATLGQLPKWTFQLGSMVTFGKNHKIIEWKNEGNLNVSLGTKDPNANPINLNSTLADIVKAMGTPDTLFANPSTESPSGLRYGDSGISLSSKGKIEAWYNAGNLKVSLGEKDPNAAPFKVGSPMEEVVKANGTPKQIQNTYSWTYGNSYVYFSPDWKVTRFENNGDLKAQ